MAAAHWTDDDENIRSLFPEELWGLIFEYVTEIDDLKNMCKASRFFRRRLILRVMNIQIELKKRVQLEGESEVLRRLMAQKHQSIREFFEFFLSPENMEYDYRAANQAINALMLQ